MNTSDELKDLQFPIGEVHPKASLKPGARQQLITDMVQLPEDLRNAVRDLEVWQIGTPYRPGGWTVKQVVHHLPDSHLNCYVRFKRALTESTPTVSTYDEAAWARLPDSESADIDVSLQLFESLTNRWTGLMEAMVDEDFHRCFRHPDLGEVSLDEIVQRYAWHGRHHLAHITRLRDRMGW